jgi:hypothetical protein
LKDRLIKSFAAEATEPETEVRSTVKAALFLLNDDRFLQLLERESGNLTDRLLKLSNSHAVAEEAYLGLLSRPPTAEETADIAAYLSDHVRRRESGVKHLVWALLTSAEFAMNH